MRIVLWLHIAIQLDTKEPAHNGCILGDDLVKLLFLPDVECSFGLLFRSTTSGIGIFRREESTLGTEEIAYRVLDDVRR
jgi:hypothetical protein